jgi:cardiolipin synthase A/B
MPSLVSRWRVALVSMLVTTLLLVAACDVTTPGVAVTGTGTPTSSGTPAATPAPGATATPCAANCFPGNGAQQVMLYVEPAAGDGDVVSAIKNAHTSIQLEIYLLTEHNVINALEDAANRGVNVQVMIEPHPVGSGSTSPQQLIAELNAAGVHAQATNPAFALTHAKIMIIDNQTAYISSGNFTLSALGGSSSTTDRDYMIVDTNSADEQECEAIFTNDWNRTTPNVSDPDLVVSPVNARARLEALIANAHTSLHLEEEEMQDPQVVQDLIGAEQRGVKVEVVVPSSSSSGSDGQNEQKLTQAGVSVVKLNANSSKVLYIHAKIIIADGTLAYVGSVNVSTQSMDQNREVGILISNTGVIQQLETTFEQDYGSGTPS